MSQASGPVLSPFRQGNIIGGKYEVMGLIGDGGMGFVVAAKHLELGENVALKFLKPDALKNPEIVARFAREARASVKIKSEYVARVFDVGNLPDGAPFIVMEHLEGEDLSSVLEKRGALPTKLAVEYVMQVCEALAAAHSLGIIHRDIKPENLFLTRRSQGMEVVKVLDFGISKVALTGSAFETNMPMVKTMMPMGSPVYMSPEQIRAEDVDPRSDIWSLGCVLYELLTGATAFDAPSITQLSAIILEKHPTPVHHLLPDVAAELEAIVDRCLEKSPEDRFQSVADLAIALYPFAPRRARISAERCSYMLHGHATSPAEFELVSIPPPGAPSDPSMSERRITNPRATNPQIGKQRLTNPRATGRGLSPMPLVDNSMAETISPEDVNFRAKSSSSKYVLYVALGAALFGGAYAVSRVLVKPTAPITATAAAVAAQQANDNPRPAAAKTAAPSAPDTASDLSGNRADGKTQAADDAGDIADKGVTSRGTPRRVYVAPRPSRAAPSRAGARHTDEVDVGF